MTDQELKKLSRAELLEMLIEQSELCDELQKKLDQAEAELKNRKIIMDSVGTMAEAAIKLSGVFEAADKAAELYLKNILQMENEIEEIRAERIEDVQKEADQILADANRESAALLEVAEHCYRDRMNQAMLEQNNSVSDSSEVDEDK